jgi:hypothetical protein
MTIYLLRREDQNDHGYIDVSVEGVFRRRMDASRQLQKERRRARKNGMRVEGDDQGDDGEWQVCWDIREYDLQ